MCVRVCLCVRVCVYVCSYVCLCVGARVCMHGCVPSLYVHAYVCYDNFYVHDV